ncbi:GvpL/GvpF family gas vesicle protein [Halalkalicoccus ordinarius]|uniref:GvpL/GvpF family gas vesicle protein n=1 Tax=Halalkalicoccus ordinarius TaxID=3116651 RepID=UPI00300ED335
MGDTALYAYGVIEREDVEFETDGVNGAERAYTVGYQTLSALVTDIDTVEPEQSDENTRAHDEVLQQLLQYDGGRTVVPMQYGMAFKNARTLKSVLREARPAFTRALREVENDVELGLKVLTEEGAEVDEEAIREEVTERFDERAISVTSDDLFSDRLIVNRSFLIDRDEREAFDRAVGEFEDDHEELLVQYTGPWAPYNFVDIEIGAQR